MFLSFFEYVLVSHAQEAPHHYGTAETYVHKDTSTTVTWFGECSALSTHKMCGVLVHERLIIKGVRYTNACVAKYFSAGRARGYGCGSRASTVRGDGGRSCQFG
jgi:hypothetical protein